MTVSELTREQLYRLKVNYLYQLADEGVYAEVVGVQYDEPSCDDILRADEIVPDNTIFEQHESTVFTEEDFND